MLHFLGLTDLASEGQLIKVRAQTLDHPSEIGSAEYKPYPVLFYLGPSRSHAVVKDCRKSGPFLMRD